MVVPCGGQTSLLQREVIDRTDAAGTHTPVEAGGPPCLPAQVLPHPPDNGVCQWDIPLMRGSFDPSHVNLELYSDDGGVPTTFSLVPGPASCDSRSNEWYYDDASDPAGVGLCPSACAELQSSPGARVAILIGCDA